MTTFNGASGPLNGDGCGCGGIVAILLAGRVIGDDTVAGAARSDVWIPTLGDGNVETAVTGCSCGRETVEIADVVLRADGFTALRVPPFDVGGVVATSSSSAEVLVSFGGDSSSTGVCAGDVDDFSEEVVSGSVDDVGSTGFSSAAEVAEVAEESAALVEADEAALESVGSASATAGVLATAQPTPSATANAPTRPTYLT